MKIALIGYGKMGHAIERHAIARGHEITARIDRHNPEEWEGEGLRRADVAIEFTTPATAFDNVERAVGMGIPTVSGTTGWGDRLDDIRRLSRESGTAFLWSSNFSIGVNIFMALNRYLASLMADLPAYHPSMREIHHIHKLDHPSGTALTLARGLMEADPAIAAWTEDASEAAPGKLLIEHEREGEVPGTHIVTWESDVDAITIEHRAKSRDGFALGAVMAAEWLADKRGCHTLDEMMRDRLRRSDLLDI